MDSYRSLDAWKIAHEACSLAYRSCDRAYQGRARAAFDQLRRAALSVETNIVEGYALGTPALCRRHLRIALGSAAEAECVVRLAGELAYLDRDVCAELEALLGRAMQVLRKLMRDPPARPDATHDVRRTTHASTHYAPRTTHV